MPLNIENSSLVAFADKLQKTLRASRYAKRVLDADSTLLHWLQANYTTPCCRAEIQALLHESGFNLQ
ncbi:MAG: hypothetical protein COS43_08215, partial [Gallionellales bacterium CG03_land_8_20_14_0_80_55_15]